jgi:carbonic anhydrase
MAIHTMVYSISHSSIGLDGPARWGEVKVDNNVCDGQRQSPINSK